MNKITLITGPKLSGKSAIALALAGKGGNHETAAVFDDLTPGNFPAARITGAAARHHLLLVADAAHKAAVIALLHRHKLHISSFIAITLNS